MTSPTETPLGDETNRGESNDAPKNHTPQTSDTQASDASHAGANVGGDKGQPTQGANVTPHPSALDAAKATFKKWLYLPDDRVLDFVFGVVFANRLNGDPVWGGIVGPPGDTKTEILRSLQHNSIYELTSLTPKTLISGLPSGMNRDKETSLLPKLNGKILVVKDLTPLISGNRETRSEILGQFRDAYDGKSSMAFGTGKTKRFESRFGMLFGVTPAIEGCWPVINQLGERFIYYRCAEGDSLAKVEAAVSNSNQKTEMREALAKAASRILSQLVPSDLTISEDIRRQVIQLADLVAKARTPVKRAGRTEEVEYAPVAEVGTRLAGQLIQLARGITAARGQSVCDESVMDLVRYVAISGIPQIRWRLLDFLRKATTTMSTSEIGQALRLGTGTARRNLEDLWQFGLVERSSRSGSADQWSLPESTRFQVQKAGLGDGAG